MVTVDPDLSVLFGNCRSPLAVGSLSNSLLTCSCRAKGTGCGLKNFGCVSGATLSLAWNEVMIQSVYQKTW